MAFFKSTTGIVLATVAAVIVMFAGCAVFIFFRGDHTFAEILARENVFPEEIADEMQALAQDLKQQVDDGVLSEEQMKAEVREELVSSLQRLVESDAISQSEMRESLEEFSQVADDGDGRAAGSMGMPDDLASFCERAESQQMPRTGDQPGDFENRGQLPAGSEVPSGSGFDFSQMQVVMQEMQSLCSDDVYTAAEEVRFDELQAAMPQRGPNGFGSE
ncbi:MAG: hypothetical protein WC505_02095 [Patescibacteria group bacterium]